MFSLQQGRCHSYDNFFFTLQLSKNRIYTSCVPNSNTVDEATHTQHDAETKNDIIELIDKNEAMLTTDEPEVDPRAEIKALRRERKRKIKTPKELAALKKEEISRKRKAYHIHVQGSDIPTPVET